MSLVLRPYQQRILQELREHWRDRPLVSLATGGGKTAVMAGLIQGAIARGKRVVFIAHRRTLVYQTRDRFKQYGIEAGIVMGCEDPGPGPVYVASIQTLARRDLQADIAICDEAHRAVSPSWKAVLARYPIVAGCTATAYRLDGAPLGDIFGHIIHGPTVQDLAAEGILCLPRIFAPPGPDLKGVHVRAGDYVPSELEAAVAKPQLIGDIVTTWERHAKGRPTVAFGVGVAHSKMIAAAFGDKGRHIDGNTSQQEREQAVADLESGRIHVLSNCDVISEGWDLPRLQCAILARPTKSMALHRQQIGRVMRACPLKDGCIVLDHAGNTARHGVPTDEVEVSLEGKAKRKVEAAPRTCKQCFAVIESYPCWDCGFEPDATEREIQQKDGELVEFISETPEQRRVWYAEQVATATALGYKLGYARMKYKERYRVWPRLKDEDAKYICAGHTWENRSYGTICARCLRTRAGVPA
jgi:DNA repair protein RadD